MADFVDRAVEHERFLLDSQIRHITSSQRPNDVDECVDCGEMIGAKRKQALPHAIRCIECQQALESRK